MNRWDGECLLMSGTMGVNGWVLEWVVGGDRDQDVDVETSKCIFMRCNRETMMFEESRSRSLYRLDLDICID